MTAGTHRVDLPEATYLPLAVAGRAFGMSVPDVVQLMMRRVCALDQPLDGDPAEPIPVYCRYKDSTVEGEYLPATNALTVLTGPLAVRRFRSPTAAARGVMQSVTPGIDASNVWAWRRFWLVERTHQPLQSVRALRKAGIVRAED